MYVCGIRGTEVKTPQGLSGHQRFRHGPPVGNVRKVDGKTQAQLESEWHEAAYETLMTELKEINHSLTIMQISLNAMMDWMKQRS